MGCACAKNNTADDGMATKEVKVQPTPSEPQYEALKMLVGLTTSEQDEKGEALRVVLKTVEPVKEPAELPPPEDEKPPKAEPELPPAQNEAEAGQGADVAP